MEMSHRFGISPPVVRGLVSGYPTELRQGGGSVAVSAAGRVTLNAVTGEAVYLQINGANAAWVTASGITTGGVVTATGTSTNTFSGPVKVSYANDGLFEADLTIASSKFIQRYRRNGAIRFATSVDATGDDIKFFTATGAAGAETVTEAFRLTGAGSYMFVQTRVGIGVSPSYPFHVSGSSFLNGLVGVLSDPSSSYQLLVGNVTATRTTAQFQQSAASATVPVVIIKLGATPGAGNDALQVQNSSGNSMFTVNSAGSLYLIKPSVATTWILSADGWGSVTATAAGTTTFTIKGASAQTADMTQWQDNSSNVLLRVSSTGSPRTANNVAYSVTDSGGSAATALLLDGSNLMNVGNASYNFNLRGANWGYTADAGATVAGYVTARINGVDRKLMVAA